MSQPLGVVGCVVNDAGNAMGVELLTICIGIPAAMPL